MSLLVTGGTGFIGRHLVKALLARGASVCVLDDLSASQALEGQPPRLRVYRGTVSDGDLVDAVIQKNDVRQIFHLATRNITRSEIDPVDAFAVNAGGTAKLLEIAKNRNVRHVIFTSTCSIYGDRMPASEEHDPDPKSVYAISKFASELRCRTSEIPTTVLRLSNVYGPGQSSDGNPYCGVIGHFMRAAFEGVPAVVYGDGYATRDYTYIEDVVGAFLTVLSRSITGTFNVSTGKETDTLELLHLIARAAQKNITIDRKPNRTIDTVRRRVVNSTKLQRISDWTPSTSLETGLTRTWDWWCHAHRS